ncbi:DUF4376 domain-containing protein [Aggregatibacter kilianii]|uniref:DUF4376 domain-containing protein n=1 Tax=Aggregatibacter kilianii TaxID=2025884 RepID=UPI000D644456|nr:DUF4376 domain-containing protein [Aggregatibacter kilianii]
MKVFFKKENTNEYVIYPEPEDKDAYHEIDVADDVDLDTKRLVEKNGKMTLVEAPENEFYTWNGQRWTLLKKNQTALLAEQRAIIRAKINAKRDQCVNGGTYVAAIGKWVDSDEKGRATLVEIKADFDLNGKDNTYTLICADNSAKTINFEEFKAVWDAVKTLKEKMFENAYMHKVLLEQAEDPMNYDWSIGWAQTYAEAISEDAEK